MWGAHVAEPAAAHDACSAYVDVAGAIFRYLKASGMASNTYVMLSSDNGPAIFPDEQPATRRKVS
jgi:arylsulfatase A-like enzyme